MPAKPSSFLSKSLLAGAIVSAVYLLIGSPASAAIINVDVSSTTSLQAILTYTAPDPGACTLKVSERSSFSPLVHAVDPSLFPGSNSDAGGALERAWVIGKRGAPVASDGKRYSAALQCNTRHYFELTCGSDRAAGSFMTSNIPLGKTFSEPVTLDPATGNYALPYRDLASRNQTIIDPLTGVLLKPVTTTVEFGQEGAYWSASGSSLICDPALSNGGYHCLIQSNRTNTPSMYWINPQTGEVRFLSFGISAGYSNFDAFYGNNYVTANDRSGQHNALFHVTYYPDDSGPTPNIPAQVDMLVPDLRSFIQAYDPQFDGAKFGGCGAVSGYSGHVVLSCKRGDQDSYGWSVVINVEGTPFVEAAVPIYAHPRSRWCSIHTPFELGDEPIAMVKLQDINGAGGGGPYLSTLTAPVSAADTLFHMNGDPASTNPRGDAHLMDIAPGDVLRGPGVFINGNPASETIRVVERVDANTWKVTRSLAVQYPAGTVFQAVCNTPYDGAEDIYWRYLDDPHGQDLSNTFYVADYRFSGDHNSERGNYRIKTGGRTGAYQVKTGGFSALNVDPDLTIIESPAFAGDTAVAPGNGVQRHPSYLNLWAPGTEKNWFLDMIPFVGLANYVASVNLGGQLYRYGQGRPLHPKTHALFAITAGTPLMDISKPGSVLTGAATDSYMYCVAETDNECVSGSHSGEVFFNVPQLDYSDCHEYGGPGIGVKDICIQDVAMHAEQIVQFGFQSDGAGGAATRGLTYALSGYRFASYFANPKPLPDGSWTLFPLSRLDNPGLVDIWMAKMPPFPLPDGKDRSTFINVPVNAGAFAGAVSAKIQYGYEENGLRTEFYCRQRRESCSVPAALGTEVNIPGIPQRILFYRVQYFDAANALIGQSKTVAAVVDQTASTAPPQPDETPLLANVSAGSIAGDSAVITWTSNRTADSKVYVGSTTALGRIISDANLVTAHRIALTGLQASTTYYFRVSSQARPDAVAQSPLQIFVTHSKSAGSLVAPGLGALRVYPNPWRKDRHASAAITFDALPSSVATVKIFSLSGHLVRELKEVQDKAGRFSIVWDRTNDSGELVASGVYLYSAANDRDQKTTGKLAIIR